MAAKGGSWKGSRFVPAGGSARAGGGGGDGGARPGSAITKAARGLRDGDITYNRTGFREESFSAVRSVYRSELAKGKSATTIATKVMDPIRLNVDRGKVYLDDGRHRLRVAREQGAKKIRAEITEYGPRGGIRAKRTVILPLRD